MESQEKPKYLEKSWLDPRIEVKNSEIEGRGLLAREPIKKGEVVIIWGGTLMTEGDIKAGRHRPHSAAEIGEGVYLAGKIEDKEVDPDELLNHSCDPNIWMRDEVSLEARRDIPRGEELTADYAMWISRPEWKMDCNCDSSVCRQMITGDDWKLKDLQERYKGHFSPYLNKRIEQLTQR